MTKARYEIVSEVHHNSTGDEDDNKYDSMISMNNTQIHINDLEQLITTL